MPSSEAEWDNIDKEFMEKWNFPNCLVALEGGKTSSSGTLYNWFLLLQQELSQRCLDGISQC